MNSKPVLPPRIPVSRQQIEAVVETFYARVRDNAVLGPVFFESLTRDAEIWRVHEAKIARFWANAILHERSYDGNPMLVHSGISALKPQMFETWLALFSETLNDLLPEPLARAWSELAHRIGRGLRIGVEQAQQPQNGPPLFS